MYMHKILALVVLTFTCAHADDGAPFPERGAFSVALNRARTGQVAVVTVRQLSLDERDAQLNSAEAILNADMNLSAGDRLWYRARCADVRAEIAHQRTQQSLSEVERVRAAEAARNRQPNVPDEGAAPSPVDASPDGAAAAGTAGGAGGVGASAAAIAPQAPKSHVKTICFWVVGGALVATALYKFAQWRGWLDKEKPKAADQPAAAEQQAQPKRRALGPDDFYWGW